MVSVLDSGTEGPGFKLQPLFTKPAKFVATLLMVARVTAGLAESNGSLLPGL